MSCGRGVVAQVGRRGGGGAGYVQLHEVGLLEVMAEQAVPDCVGRRGSGHQHRCERHPIHIHNDTGRTGLPEVSVEAVALVSYVGRCISILDLCVRGHATGHSR